MKFLRNLTRVAFRSAHHGITPASPLVIHDPGEFRQPGAQAFIRFHFENHHRPALSFDVHPQDAAIPYVDALRHL